MAEKTREELIAQAKSKWFQSLSREEKIAHLRSLEQQEPQAEPEKSLESKTRDTAEQIQTGARGFLSSVTAGLSEPVASGLSAAMKYGLERVDLPGAPAEENPRSFSELYAEDVANRERLKEKYPVTETAGEIGGAFIPVGAAAKIFSGGQKVVKGLGAAEKIAEYAPKLKGLAKAGEAVVGAGLGAGLLQGTRNVALGVGGFKSEEPSALEAAETGAKFQAGIEAIPVVGRGLGKLGKAAFASTFGIKSKAITDFLERPDAVKNAPTQSELNDMVMGTVDRLKEEAKKHELNFIDEIQGGIAGLKQKVIDESEKAYDILAKSDVTIKRSRLLQIASLAQNKLKVAGSGPVGESAIAALEKINDLKTRIRNLPEIIDAADIKQVIQQIDKDIAYVQSPGGFSTNYAQSILGDIRHGIDSVIKTKIPKYEKQMEKVSTITGLLKETDKVLGSKEKAFSALQNLENKPLKTELMGRFFKSQKIDPERYLAAKEAAKRFKGWTEKSVESKLKDFMGRGSENTKRELLDLSKMGDGDFAQLAKDLQLRNQFEAEFIRGSRNVNLWSIMAAGTRALVGTTGGLLASGDPMVAAMTGATFGAMIDKYGPTMARQILEKVSQVQGMPTVQKISRMNLPAQVRADLSNSLIRAISTGGTEEGETYVEPEYRGEIINEIKNSNLTPTQKATKIKMIVKDGVTKDLPSIVVGKPVGSAAAITPPKKPTNPPSRANASNFESGRRKEEF